MQLGFSGNVDVSRKRASDLLHILKEAKRLSHQKWYDLRQVTAKNKKWVTRVRNQGWTVCSRGSARYMPFLRGFEVEFKMGHAVQAQTESVAELEQHMSTPKLHLKVGPRKTRAMVEISGCTVEAPDQKFIFTSYRPSLHVRDLPSILLASIRY